MQKIRFGIAETAAYDPLFIFKHLVTNLYAEQSFRFGVGADAGVGVGALGYAHAHNTADLDWKDSKVAVATSSGWLCPPLIALINTTKCLSPGQRVRP